jgi:hypothetical protein
MYSIASNTRPLIPSELNAVKASAEEPVKVVTVEASIVPEVLESRVVNTVEETVVSVKVTASLPKPLIPSEVTAVFTSAADPVIVVVAVAVTCTVVAPSIVFRFAAVTVESPTVIV